MILLKVDENDDFVESRWKLSIGQLLNQGFEVTSFSPRKKFKALQKGVASDILTFDSIFWKRFYKFFSAIHATLELELSDWFKMATWLEISNEKTSIRAESKLHWKIELYKHYSKLHKESWSWGTKSNRKYRNIDIFERKLRQSIRTSLVAEASIAAKVAMYGTATHFILHLTRLR